MYKIIVVKSLLFQIKVDKSQLLQRAILGL